MLIDFSLKSKYEAMHSSFSFVIIHFKYLFININMGKKHNMQYADITFLDAIASLDLGYESK